MDPLSMNCSNPMSLGRLMLQVRRRCNAIAHPATIMLAVALSLATPIHGSNTRGVPVLWSDMRTGVECLLSTTVSTSGGYIAWEKSVLTPEAALLPINAHLSDVYPNPLIGGAPGTVSINVEGESRRLRLALYDLLGRERMLLCDQHHDAGTATVRFAPDMNTLPSGVYRLVLRDGERLMSRTLLLLK